MHSYLHANSSILPPVLDREALPLYRAIIAGEPVVIVPGHYTPDDLNLVAERLRCDEVVRGLVAWGVEAEVVDRPEAGYVEAAVNIQGLETMVSVDAAAAARILQRVESGLTPEEAVARTLDQCDKPVLSGHALRELERTAAAAERRCLRGEPLPLVLIS